MDEKIYTSTEEYEFEKKINALKSASINDADINAIQNLVKVLAYLPAEKLDIASGIISAVERQTGIRDRDITQMRDYFSDGDRSLEINVEECTTSSQVAKITTYHRQYDFYHKFFKPFLKAKYLISVREYPEASGILAQFK